MPDKTYRIVVIALLAVITLVQIITAFGGSSPSEECSAALDAASTVTTSIDEVLETLLTDYQTSAYDIADNINQQIFFANEFQVIALQQIGIQNAALVNVAANCN